MFDLASLQLFILCLFILLSVFFFNDTATTEIYTLSLHDALPISFSHFYKFVRSLNSQLGYPLQVWRTLSHSVITLRRLVRSEEHTSELQSLTNLVCRLLLEKKKQKQISKPRNNTSGDKHYEHAQK